jgi:hypothetical protein
MTASTFPALLQRFFTDRLCTQMEAIAEIRRSRFVVADYTGHRGGVYFEAGFALGLGLIVIPTCRADEVPKLHFDIKHLNTLLWSTPAELADPARRLLRRPCIRRHRNVSLGHCTRLLVRETETSHANVKTIKRRFVGRGVQIFARV